MGLISTQYRLVSIQTLYREVWCEVLDINIRVAVIQCIKPSIETRSVTCNGVIVYPTDRDKPVSVAVLDQSYEFTVSWMEGKLAFRSRDEIPITPSDGARFSNQFILERDTLLELNPDLSSDISGLDDLTVTDNPYNRLDPALEKIWSEYALSKAFVHSIQGAEVANIQRRLGFADPKFYSQQDMESIASLLSLSTHDTMLALYLQREVKQVCVHRKASLRLLEHAMSEALTQFFSVRIQQVEEPKYQANDLVFDALILFISLSGPGKVINLAAATFLKKYSTRAAGGAYSAAQNVIQHIKRSGLRNLAPTSSATGNASDNVQAITAALKSGTGESGYSRLKRWVGLRNDLVDAVAQDGVSFLKTGMDAAKKISSVQRGVSGTDAPQVVIQSSVQAFVRRELLFYENLELACDFIAQESIHNPASADRNLFMLADIIRTYRDRLYSYDSEDNTTYTLAMNFEFILWSLYVGPFISKVRYIPPSWTVTVSPGSYRTSPIKGGRTEETLVIAGDVAEVEGKGKRLAKLDYLANRFFTFLGNDSRSGKETEEQKKAFVAEKLLEQYQALSASPDLSKEEMQLFIFER